MGEAKRKRLAAAATVEKQIQPELIPDYFKGVAEIVNAFAVPGSDIVGGFCMPKAMIAYQTVRADGLDASIAIGGMLLRTGPSPKYDVLAWCGPHNMGQIHNDRFPIFHCWIRYDDWIFDPTVGDWRQLEVDTMEKMAFGEAWRPMQWDIELPRYWLKRASEVEAAWRSHGEPALGEVWYCPFHGSADSLKQLMLEVYARTGGEIAFGVEHLKREFAAKHGLPYERNDTVYPLKFSVCRR